MSDLHPGADAGGGPDEATGGGTADAPGRDAKAGAGDLMRLGARMGGGWLREPGRHDTGSDVCRWAREMMTREGAAGVEMGLAGRNVRLVGDAERSETILSDDPEEGQWGVSPLKADAMGFLAPGALTVAEGHRWVRLREFNERVLATGRAHPLASAFLPRIRAAFERPVGDAGAVRTAMGRAMVGIVLGEVPGGSHPADDVTVLFGAVQSPVKRKLLGFLYGPRRERFFDLLRRQWDATEPGSDTLLGRARAHAGTLPRDEVLQQVPHWMFTFTGSGADLLVRTLALVGSRPDVRRRLRDEFEAADRTGRVASPDAHPLAEACILEAGRLFPPVTRTFHRERGAGAADTVHWFPLLQRSDALGPTVHDFRPDRWLDDGPDDPARASNLFLRGPRACPGKDLILFVCRAALARQVGELGVVARDPSLLARDPLPISFPSRAARFTTGD